MSIEVGMKFHIQDTVKDIYNGAHTMTILTKNEKTVQFLLADGKGHGAMPITHLQYLIRKADLKEIPSKRSYLAGEDKEEEIS